MEIYEGKLSYNSLAKYIISRSEEEGVDPLELMWELIGKLGIRNESEELFESVSAFSALGISLADEMGIEENLPEEYKKTIDDTLEELKEH